MSLDPGQKSRDRGSTFKNPRSELERKPEHQLGRSSNLASSAQRARVKRENSNSTLSQGRGFSASPAQQKKANTQPCIVTQQEAIEGATVDPAHLWPRGRGGCDDPLCTLPLRRDVHRAFDDGDFDLLPYLADHSAEVLHALGHALEDGGGLLALLHRLTGERYVPKVEAA